ncbi:hypothetical protein [Hymenobacter siberiensis]|uniref:hypothetical protein n=1 Tax=Hymenobacter siberiensis TaxID=2848396 RepID=UPI001C1E7174|nr:hypothetical protein [Hymenobacter siberiensis]
MQLLLAGAQPGFGLGHVLKNIKLQRAARPVVEMHGENIGQRVGLHYMGYVAQAHGGGLRHPHALQPLNGVKPRPHQRHVVVEQAGVAKPLQDVQVVVGPAQGFLHVDEAAPGSPQPAAGLLREGTPTAIGIGKKAQNYGRSK